MTKQLQHATMTTDEIKRGKRLFGIAMSAGDPAAFKRLVPLAVRQEIEADPKHEVLLSAPPDNAMVQRAALDLIADGLKSVAGIGPLRAGHVFLEAWACLSTDHDLRAERQLVNAWLRSRGVDAEMAPRNSSN